jgi:hypothetical protein
VEKTKKENKFEYEYKKDYESDWDIHRNYINTDFDAYEAMLIGQVYDSVSGSVDGSKITDSYAATLAKERADRVVAKLPEGETVPVGKADVGKAAFMDILLQKWIYPNANSQHPFLEKLNLWQLYSSVYGYMPMFYDWNVSHTGYVGPDCWLWNPRNLVPQQGRTSIEDMDYVTALTWVSKGYLEDIMEDLSEEDEGGWNKDALKLLIEIGESTSDQDQEKDTKIARDRTPGSVKKGICLATRYEAGEDGEWVTFAPDHSCVEVRRLPNPHKNGRIPFVIKYSQPLFDSFYGLGDFQRAKPLQFARDGLTNFYFKGIKMNLIPPIIVNGNGVLKHTIDYREGAVMVETIPNSIRRLETSTAGLATYQGAQSNLTGSLLSLYGSQNASIPGAESLNPSQGKTPSAINLYSDKEATRDGSERRHLVAAIEQLVAGFFSLVANVGTEDIPVDLFAEDIQDIAKAGLEDIVGLFSGDFQIDGSMSAGTLKIDPTKLKGVDYRFKMDMDSTAKVNKEQQLQNLERYVDNMGKFQNMFKDDPRIEFHPDRISVAFGNLAGVQNADEFITVKDGPSPAELQMQQEMEQMQQEMQQMQHEKQVQELQNAAPEQSQPVVAQNGQVFNDPIVGQAVDKLSQM